MYDWLNHYRNNRYWFWGSNAVFLIIFLFFWRVIDQASFTHYINGFMVDMWELMTFLLTIVIILIGCKIAFKYVFPKKGGAKSHH